MLICSVINEADIYLPIRGLAKSLPTDCIFSLLLMTAPVDSRRFLPLRESNIILCRNSSTDGATNLFRPFSSRGATTETPWESTQIKGWRV